MNNWTPAASQVWDEYLEQNRARIAASGGDVEEIFGDLRRHVEAELAAQKLPIITEQDVRQALQKLGPLPNVDFTPPVNEKPKPSSGKFTVLGFLLLQFFGVILPFGVLLFELASHACASEMFDPLPTYFHVLLVAVVPVANGLAGWFVQRRKTIPRWLWISNAVAFGISAFYAILFLPTTPFALIGIIFLGFGFIPLAPLCSFLCAWRLRHLLVRHHPESAPRLSRPGWWGAMAAGFLVLSLLAVSTILTRYWIREAANAGNPNPDVIKLLRSFGDREVLLRSCYGQSQSDSFDYMFRTAQRPTPEAVRSVYYRVTGQPFNSVPPPLNKYRGAGQAIREDYEWDEGLGGEAVVGRIKHLSLAQSRMDGAAKPEEGWAYLEWTLEFKNDNTVQAREARAEIQLPPGGVVSRVTLWINGEEREAAFGGRGQVREAYQKIAVQRRRDPVLVTTSGSDRVLVQCFPVPSKGGRMKIRLGITAPLGILGEHSSALRLPCFVERNFGVPASLEHNLWLESPTPVQTGLCHVTQEAIDGKAGVHGGLSEHELTSTNAVLRFGAAPVSSRLLAADPLVPGQFIEQTVTAIPGAKPSRIAIMLDGSRNMTPYYRDIASFLKTIPTATETRIWLEQDQLDLIYDSSWNQVGDPSKRVVNLRGEGGQDNLQGLLHAWDWATEKPGGIVLWIHADQPAQLENFLALQQRLDWRSGSNAPTIVDVPVFPAPNRITQELANLPTVSALPRYGTLPDDLNRLCSQWFGQAHYEYARKPADSDGMQATASAHIVRLWALEQSRQLLRNHKIKEATDCAATHQLVTPVSGAVVLETKAQYDEFGLTPADATTVPSVPEPSTLILGAMAAFAFFVWRRRHGKTRRQALSH